MAGIAVALLVVIGVLIRQQIVAMRQRDAALYEQALLRWLDGKGIGYAVSADMTRELAAAIREEAPEIVFAGKQAIDDDAVQVPGMVAEMLGWNAKRADNLVYRGLADLRRCLTAKGIEP